LGREDDTGYFVVRENINLEDNPKICASFKFFLKDSVAIQESLVLYKSFNTLWVETSDLQERPLLPPPSTEPVFVNLLKSPGIDTQPIGPVGQPNLSGCSARLHRLAESLPRN
jgi:hypothetical protein